MWTVSDSDLGTPESEWLASDRLRLLPPVSWRHPDRVVVVAPHPDDEVLGVGGGLRWLAGIGADITVLAVTDGEGSHPGSPSMSADVLGATRRAESEEGLRRLGLVDPVVLPLGIPDGSVADHEIVLSERLCQLLDERTLCLATWRHDGHPDHEAAGRAASTAAALSGSRLLEFPVWAWHWARPESSGGQGFPWSVARTFGLDRRSVRAKHLAIEAFTSQIRPIGPNPEDRTVLPGPVLDRFRRPFEVLFEHGDSVET